MLIMQNELDLDMDFLRHTPSGKRLQEIKAFHSLLKPNDEIIYKDCLYDPIRGEATIIPRDADDVDIPESFVVVYPCTTLGPIPNYFRMDWFSLFAAINGTYIRGYYITIKEYHDDGSVSVERSCENTGDILIKRLNRVNANTSLIQGVLEIFQCESL